MTKAVGVAQCGRGSVWAWLGVVSAIPRRGCPWGSEVHCLSVVNQAGCSTECQWQQVYRGYPVDEVANGLHPGSTPTRLDSGTEIRTRQAFQSVLCRSPSSSVLKQGSCPGDGRQVNWTELFLLGCAFNFDTIVLRSHAQYEHSLCPFGAHWLHPSEVEMYAPFDQ